jgi:class 3 adenylate cyclase
MHSGPVTAGVLRGEKSRFQLFGDTMNTASRMESTGDAGKIQVSEVTARLLKADGKGYWLTKRQGTIVIKGKGEMQVGRNLLWHYPCACPPCAHTFL